MIDVEAFYTRYSPMVLRRCRRLLRDEHLALDAMQETFMQVLRNKSTLQEIAPSSLLFRIATNICLNRLRTVRRHPETPDETLLASVMDAVDNEHATSIRERLAKIFSGEEHSTLTMAVLHFVDGMTLEETAREMQMSVSGVRKRLGGLKLRAVQP